jgi:hypothetical protein
MFHRTVKEMEARAKAQEFFCKKKFISTKRLLFKTSKQNKLSALLCLKLQHGYLPGMLNKVIRRLKNLLYK